MISRGWVFILLIALVIVGGILAAMAVRIGNESKTLPAPITKGVRLTEILVGTPLGDTPAKAGPADPINQKRSGYKTTDPIMVRITNDAPPHEQLTITTRLVRDDGSIITLQPATFQISGGVSGFCCWLMPDPGQYNLQVFRPDGTVTVLPLKIVE